MGRRVRLGGRIPAWVCRRIFVMVCIFAVTAAVSNVALLVALFGAVGQAGLSTAPCLIHLRLQSMGLVPRSRVLSCVNCVVFVVCSVVMVFGTYFSIKAIADN